MAHILPIESFILLINIKLVNDIFILIHFWIDLSFKFLSNGVLGFRMFVYSLCEVIF